MCGIAGWITGSDAIPERTHIEAMTATLTHRGPDDGAVFLDRGVALGHRRLSIIDLSSAGRQPMCDPTRRWWIVYNGEVYNFRALRDELRQRGVTFQTETDTEVVLAAFIEWGPDSLNKLNGMFAMAIWDRAEGECWLIRDRFGIKPLVYGTTPEGGLLFGSELKALLAAPGVDRTLDTEALGLYLTLSYIPEPHTIFQRFRKLPHGTIAHWKSGRLSLRKWYDMREHLSDSPDSYDEAQGLLREKMETAVSRRMISDVPLGAFLSGGIDSSTVVALMARGSSARVKTYSIGFPDEPLFDESRYAQAVADKYNTDHTLFPVTSSDALEAIEGVLGHCDEPFGDSSAVPTAMVSGLTRQSVTVALSGDAADEMFAGYRKYVGEAYAKRYQMLPGWLRRGIITPLLESLSAPRTSRLGERIRWAQRFVEGAAKSPAARHASWMTIVDPDLQTRLFPDLELDGSKALTERIGALHESWQDCSINRVLYGDLETCLPYDMFNKVDWMSMRSSLEVRVPFADHEVAELAFSLPQSWKIKGSNRKRILVDTFKDLLPKLLHGRPKQGFEAPLAYWFRGPLKTIFRDTVASAKQAGVPLSLSAIEGLEKEHQSGHRDHGARLWTLFAYCHWAVQGPDHSRKTAVSVSLVTP